MKRLRSGAVLAAAGVAALFLLLLVAGRDALSQAVQGFLPPRTAVVEINAIFSGFEKKRVREEQLVAQLQDLKGILEKLKQEDKDLELELRQLKEDSEIYLEKLQRKLELQFTAKKLQATELKALEQKQLEFLREIQDEIAKEIAAFARAHNLDLVFDRTVSLQVDASSPPFRWPLVHYSKPELDITQEITKRLNEKHKQSLTPRR
jgi:Skp family chaperone for outer membrane proteins